MARRTWPLAVGGIGAAAAVAVVSILVVRNDDAERKERERVASRAAELEREHQRALAEEKVRVAEAVAIAAAEKIRVAAEEAKAREAAIQTARAQAIEAARTQGVLGSAALLQGGAFASLTGTGDISSGFDNADIYGGLIGNEAGEMAGGFGFGGSGFGPGGGGGSGAGAIGLGSYGTLGHGSGTGQGYGTGNGRGGMRGRTAAAPSVRLAVSQVNGELDTAIVRRILRRHQAKVNYCYEKQLLVEPALQGAVTVRFEIDERGAVSASDANGLNDEVASCVAAVIRGTSFPAPTSGTVGVTASFAMKP